jgi:hypothetical protein
MVVASGRSPAVIPEEEIHAVRRLVENSEGVEPYPFLKCGDGYESSLARWRGLKGFSSGKRVYSVGDIHKDSQQVGFSRN